jgi:hypothetical protein
MTASDDTIRPVAGSSDDRPGSRADGRRARRQRARRRALRRRRLLAALVLVAGGALVALLLIGGSPGARPGSAQRRAQPAAGQAYARRPAIPVHRTPARAGRPVQSTAPSPGSLPQTHAYPSSTDARFRGLMASLWTGVVQDSPAPAMAAFFPRGAYVQLKAIYSASSDWTERLVGDYGLDIAAAHMLLGADAAHAGLVGVQVPSGYGH